MDARLTAHGKTTAVTAATAAAAAHGGASQVRTYLIIFGCLAALTLATVGVAYMHLPHAAAIVVALGIAITKVALIALFFMHLKFEGGLINIAMATAVLLIIWLLV